MNTCENCYFWHRENPQDVAANCIVEPPRVLPLHTAGKMVLQNIYPTTTRDMYCRHHDTRPRPVIKVVQEIPGSN